MPFRDDDWQEVPPFRAKQLSTSWRIRVNGVAHFSRLPLRWSAALALSHRVAAWHRLPVLRRASRAPTPAPRESRRPPVCRVDS